MNMLIATRDNVISVDVDHLSASQNLCGHLASK